MGRTRTLDMEAQVDGRRQTKGRMPSGSHGQTSRHAVPLEDLLGQVIPVDRRLPTGNTQFRYEIGLGDECPANETIRWAMFFLDESYLRRLNKRILAEPRNVDCR